MLESVIGTSITLQSFLLCTAVSLVLGIGLAFVAGYRQKTSSSFAVTLALLPAVVQLVIMLVNGNIGTGVAVAGAFSLVRLVVPKQGIETAVIPLGSNCIASKARTVASNAKVESNPPDRPITT